MVSPILSPCRNICAIDKTGQVCTGCRRTLDEIARWGGMTDAERSAIIARLGGATQI